MDRSLSSRNCGETSAILEVPDRIAVPRARPRNLPRSGLLRCAGAMVPAKDQNAGGSTRLWSTMVLADRRFVDIVLV